VIEDAMQKTPLVSILINNYNYGRFVAHAVASALQQTYPHIEVIVVDDGSTDDSRTTVEPYRDRATIISQSNAGQASAMNTGFARSSGEIVHFLDADDLLHPNAIERVVDAFQDSRVVKVHWPLVLIDEAGRATGGIKPADPLASGDLSHLLQEDCLEHVTPPQSGNAWTRAFLADVLPLDEQVYRTGGSDTCLSLLTLPFGHLAALDAPLGCYRQHHASHWTGVDVLTRVPLGVQRYAHACESLAQVCRRRGFPSKSSAWIQNSWLYKLNDFMELICRFVPDGDAFILVDQDHYGLPAQIGNRRRFFFTDGGGFYNGPPTDNAAAIAELERLRKSGATFILIAATSFWWLEYYAEFRHYLDERFALVIDEDRMIGFRLDPLR
jgi:glycosyltransferase involved in cell wall biosynthesis